MTYKQLIKELCKREGKKVQVNAAQMQEIVGCMADLLFENDSKAMNVMVRLYQRRKHLRLKNGRD